jgi:hypothetical protein
VTRALAILIALVCAGCTIRANPGARCSWTFTDASDFAPQVRGDFDAQTGAIRVRNDLWPSVTALVAVHEFVHACEANPRLAPREVLRLYACPAWPALDGDLLDFPPTVP